MRCDKEKNKELVLIVKFMGNQHQLIDINLKISIIIVE